MSRAFVKEQEGGEELPDRPVGTARNLVTRRGLELIEAELAASRAALAAAEAAGDRSAAARASRDLRYWSARRATAEPTDPPSETDQVRFGLSVTLENDAGLRKTWRIVGEDEADAAAGLVGHTSPLAAALYGKGAGDEVTVAGRTWEIVAIER